MSAIGILGAGSWGTALGVEFARQGHEVVLWARRQELADELAASRVNRVYLPEAPLPERLRPTHRLAELDDCETVLAVIPSHGYREVMAEFLEARPADRPVIVISATKGIDEHGLRMSEVTAQEAARTGRQVRFAVLAGPTFAADLAAAKPSLGVIAAEDEVLARQLQEQLSSKTFRLYSTTDVVGVELASTSKNVIAIAAGLVVGLGLGHNTMAALITRGLHEITRLGVAFGGKKETFAGLAGLGDLVLTCTGGLSRNRRAGMALAEGQTLEQITGGAMVAEGIKNARYIADLAHSRGVEMPITEQMVDVLYDGKDVQPALEELMTRSLKAEALL